MTSSPQEQGNNNNNNNNNSDDDDDLLLPTLVRREMMMDSSSDDDDGGEENSNTGEEEEQAPPPNLDNDEDNDGYTPEQKAKFIHERLPLIVQDHIMPAGKIDPGTLNPWEARVLHNAIVEHLLTVDEKLKLSDYREQQLKGKGVVDEDDYPIVGLIERETDDTLKGADEIFPLEEEVASAFVGASDELIHDEFYSLEGLMYTAKAKSLLAHAFKGKEDYWNGSDGSATAKEAQSEKHIGRDISSPRKAIDTVLELDSLVGATVRDVVLAGAAFTFEDSEELELTLDSFVSARYDETKVFVSRKQFNSLVRKRIELQTEILEALPLRDAKTAATGN